GIILRGRRRRSERRHREESRKESAASTGRWHGHSPWYFSAAALPANMSFRQVLRRRSWWRNGGTCLPSWRFDADPNRVLGSQAAAGIVRTQCSARSHLTATGYPRLEARTDDLFGNPRGL